MACIVDEYLYAGIAAVCREQKSIRVRADRSMLFFRPICSLVYCLKTSADCVEVVALQLAQIAAYAKPGYGKLSRLYVRSNSRLSFLVIYNEFVFVEVKAYMVTIFALHHDDDLVAGV